MQDGAATLENSVAFPQKVKNRATLQPNNCTTGYLSKGYKHSDLKGHVHPDVHSSNVHNSQIWKEPRCPLTGECIKKM